MNRFLLSAFSVLLATAAVAPTAQALPKVDADFNIQTLRLSEFDARNKSDAPEQPYDYSEASTQPLPQAVSVEDASTQTAEPTAWESPTTWERPSTPVEAPSPALSLTEQRQQFLDRNL